LSSDRSFGGRCRRFVRDVLDAGIAFDAAYFRPRGEGHHDIAVALHQDQVDNVERAVLDTIGLQPIQHWLLCLQSVAIESFVDVTTFLCLARESVGPTQAGLLIQDDEKLGGFTIPGSLEYPRRDLA